MSKQTKLTLLASVLFYVAGAAAYITGTQQSMSYLWLLLGCAFLCLGVTNYKKDKEK